VFEDARRSIATHDTRVSSRLIVFDRSIDHNSINHLHIEQSSSPSSSWSTYLGIGNDVRRHIRRGFTNARTRAHDESAERRPMTIDFDCLSEGCYFLELPMDRSIQSMNARRRARRR
jgi:hypothetical protein